MRAVVQRVSHAQVSVEGRTVGQCDTGLCVLVGVAREDSLSDAEMLADKVTGLRIFEDDAGKMNRSVLDVHGSLLAISQFTLLGDCRKGRRPSFAAAMDPDAARDIFNAFCAACRERGVEVETGTFRARMAVELVNQGPVTLLLDTHKTF